MRRDPAHRARRAPATRARRRRTARSCGARGDGLDAGDARPRRPGRSRRSPRTRPRSAPRSSTASATSARSPRIRTSAPSCASTCVKGRAGEPGRERRRRRATGSTRSSTGRCCPTGSRASSVLALIDDFYELGPMGFRGPAAHDVPDHVTSLDDETAHDAADRAGLPLPVERAARRRFSRARGEDYLFITSANVSSGVTGRVEAGALRPARHAGGLRRRGRHRPDRPSRRGRGARAVPAPPADVDVDPRLPQARAGRGREARR